MDRVFILQYHTDDSFATEVYASPKSCADRMLELDNAEDPSDVERDHIAKILDEGIEVFLQEGEIVSKGDIDPTEAKLWLHGFVQQVNP